MSMTDDLTIAPGEPKKRIKKKRKIVPKAKRTQLAKDYWLAGMTHLKCAEGCRPDRCVVSHRPYCAHPFKGGLQPIDLNNREALDRLNETKEFLGPPIVQRR